MLDDKISQYLDILAKAAAHVGPEETRCWNL